MLFVLCYPDLSQGGLARIEAFRNRHEPERARLVPAHVTLVFGVRSITADALAALAADAAAATDPFAISLPRTEAYEDPSGEHKLFLMVEQGAAALIRLHERLHVGRLAAERRPELPFRPHVTVATAGSREAIGRAGSEAARLLPLHGRIEHLTVAELRGGSAIVSIAELRLGG